MTGVHVHGSPVWVPGLDLRKLLVGETEAPLNKISLFLLGNSYK